jgi:zinc protease
VLSSLVDLEIHGLPGDGLDTYRSRVAAVTPEKAAGLAEAHLHPDRLAIVAVGPAEALQEALAGLGPVEIVEP